MQAIPLSRTHSAAIIFLLIALYLLSGPLVAFESSDAPKLFLLNNLPGRNFVFDGLLYPRLRFFEIDLPEDSRAEDGFGIKVRFRKRLQPESFKMYFASTGLGLLYYAYDDDQPENRGIFSERRSGDEKLISFSGMSQSCSRDIGITVRDGSIEAAEDGGRRVTAFTEEIEGPVFRIVSRLEPVVLDRIEISSTNPGGGYHSIVGNEFISTPVFFDLPCSLRLFPASLSCIILSFLLLCAVSFLFDKSLLTLIRIFRVAPDTWSRWLFIFLPLGSSILFVARSMLALPISSLAASVTAAAVVKAALLLRTGRSRTGEGKSAGFAPRVVFAAGMIFFVFSIPSLHSELVGARGLSNVESGFLLSAPVFLSVFALLLSRRYPVETFGAAVFQFAGFLLFERFCGFPDLVTYSFLIMLPWSLWTTGYIVRHSKKKSLSAVFAICAFPLLLPGGFELLLRSNLLTNTSLDFRQGALTRFSDLEKYTGLFGSPGDETIIIRDTGYAVTKPPGRYRIVALGSSSTWGSGAGALPCGAYPFKLESSLCSRGLDVEVINAGICGASLYMLQVYFDEVLSLFRPNLLILYFGENRDKRGLDIFYNDLKTKVAAAPYIDSTVKLAAAEQTGVDSWWMVGVVIRLSGLRSFTAAVKLGELLRNTGMKEPVVKKYVLEGCGEFIAETPERIVRRSLRNGTEVLLAPEISFDAMVSRHETHEYYESFSRLAANFSQEGVYFLNLLDYFSGVYENGSVRSGASAMYADKIHMTESGYELLAEQIARFLIERDILPEPEPQVISRM